MSATEVTQWRDAFPTQAVTVADFQGRAVERLAEWAQSAEAAYQVATRLVESSFVPAQFKGKPVEAAAAILAGIEVGLQPMASLRSFDIIQGTAAARALTLRAIVQSHGHEIQQVEATSSRCVMQGRRRGSQDWQKVTWTIERARELGLVTKDNWKKQPQAMLVARATSEIARLIAADAILGIGYSVEEIEDGAGTYAPGEPSAPRQTRTLKRAAAEPDTITDAQSKKLHALVNEAGMDRDGKLAFAASVVGHEVTTTNDLSKDEAARVIDALDTPQTPTDPAPAPKDTEHAGDVGPATPEQVATIKEWVETLGLTATTAKATIRRAVGRDDATTANLTHTEAAEAIAALVAESQSAEPMESLLDGGE